MHKKVASFILGQINQICAGGLPVLLRKSYTFLLMLLAVPVVLLVRLLQPLVVIRIEPLHSARIGHFIHNTEVYLCERDAGMHSRRTFDIFYHDLSICNFQVKKMWERTKGLHISPFTKFTHTVGRLNSLLPGGQRHTIVTSARDIYGLRASRKPYLSFTPEEERLGRQELQKLGIPDGGSFICFHARDSAYLDAVKPNYNWCYHDYRDSNIHNYIPAVEGLARQGYFMVRMGAVVKEPMPTNSPMIIHYATKGRTEFLDIYLGAKCRFFITSTAGIAEIAEAFRRPMVWVNYIPLGLVHTWGAKQLFIPKKLWLRDEHRFLTFREILDSEIARLYSSEEYEQLSIEAIENTPEEITDVVAEMDERLKDKWQTTEEDEQLQRRFWALFKASELNQVFLSRIGAEFLRQNRKLLE